MAFSVKQVKAKLQEYGVPAEQLEAAAEYFCAAHKTALDAIKEERDAFKADAEELAGARKELAELRAESEKHRGKNTFEVKYNALKEDFAKYKAEQEAKESKAAKSAAYRRLLKEAGISEKRLDAVLRVSDVDAIELNNDGEIKGADKLMDSVREEWADFIASTAVKGAITPMPPKNTARQVKTLEEIYKTDDSGRYVYDAGQRQQFRAELNAAQRQGG